MSHWRRYTPIVVLLAGVSSTHADAYPTRPIRLVAPFPAGGTADVLARQVSTDVSTHLGQSIVVDNRSGANGIIGTDTVAKAPPDGHTLLHVTASFVINQHIYRKLPYDVFKDFDPVTNVVLGTGYLVLLNPSVPASSVKELIALAKKTGNVTYSSPGVGNTLHLAAELFNVRTGVKLLHVPYKGVAPAKTPSAILSRLHREVYKVLQTPRVREAIVAGGYEPDGRSPGEFRKFLRQEYDRYGEMLRVANVPKE